MNHFNEANTVEAFLRDQLSSDPILDFRLGILDCSRLT